MPTLIVEDGSIVANANSYIDVAYLNAFAADRGFTIPSTTTDKEILIIKAMDYVESKSFKGKKVDATQSLQWPRENVRIDCSVLDFDDIPEMLKRAVAQLVVEQHAGISLYPKPVTTSQEGFVTEKTVGPLTKKFSAVGAKSTSTPAVISSVEVFLKPLTVNSGALQTVRI